MTDEGRNGHMSNDAVELPYQTLPTLQQWSEQESNNLMLAQGKIFLPIVLRLMALATIAYYVPFIWTVIWGVSIFGIHFWLRNLRAEYKSLLNAKPSSILVMAPMEHIARMYKTAVMSSCIAWCGLSFLSQTWLPTNLRVVCIVIFNMVMLLALAQTYTDRVLMYRSLIILLTAQMVFSILRLSIIGFDNEALIQVGIYYSYLIIIGFVLWSIGNHFNKIHIERLNAEYSKLQLIDTLDKNKAQLQIEQQALVASNNLVQQFYSGAAHDLRQPVYAMQLYTTMLSDEPNLSKALLPKITQSCVAINDMFNTLFDYQQTHMNDTDLVEKNISIEECFNSLALHFQPVATGKGLQIQFKSIPGSVTVVPLYLTRILSNLIANALRYTNTGCVLIAARQKRNHISLEVWDTGIGIEASALDKIFKEFYKISSAEFSNDGLGLGLSIVKQLCARIEGADITVKSRLGRGSVFKFSMPLSKFNAR